MDEINKSMKSNKLQIVHIIAIIKQILNKSQAEG